MPFNFLPNTDKAAAKFNNEVIPKDWSGCHPHEYLNVRIMGKMFGALTTVHPLTLRQFKIKGNLSIAIIDFNLLENKAPKEKFNYKPINKFPVSTFDCSVVASNDTAAEDVLAALNKVKLKELTNKKIVDVFDLGDGNKSVTLRSFLEDPTQTLGHEFIKQAEEKIIGALDAAGFPLKE